MTTETELTVVVTNRNEAHDPTTLRRLVKNAVRAEMAQHSGNWEIDVVVKSHGPAS